MCGRAVGSAAFPLSLPGHRPTYSRHGRWSGQHWRLLPGFWYPTPCWSGRAHLLGPPRFLRQVCLYDYSGSKEPEQSTALGTQMWMRATLAAQRHEGPSSTQELGCLRSSGRPGAWATCMHAHAESFSFPEAFGQFFECLDVSFSLSVLQTQCLLLRWEFTNSPLHATTETEGPKNAARVAGRGTRDAGRAQGPRGPSSLLQLQPPSHGPLRGRRWLSRLPGKPGV